MAFPARQIAALCALSGAAATVYVEPQWSHSAFVAYSAALFALALLGWALWATVLYPKYLSPLRGLPEPEHVSLREIGELQLLPKGDAIMKWFSTVPNNGLIRYLGLFNQERLVVTTPKAIAEVLVTRPYDFRKPAIIRVGLGRILGNGLLLAEHDEHRRQRRILMPAFGFRHIKNLYPVFWDKARESVCAVRDHVLAAAAQRGDADPTACIEVTSWASRITLDIIGLAGLGQDFGAIADPANSLSQTYHRVFRPSRQALLLNTLKLFLPARLVHALPLRRNREIEAAARTIRGVCHALIRDKKARLARAEPADVDILSAALESGGFADDALVDQLMTFLVAGHETVASSITWAVYALCRHPEMQARLRREVRAQLPSVAAAADATTAATTVASADLDARRMPYLHAVCAEVLRYWAPTPVSMREAAVDTSIQGVRVPAGTRVLVDMLASNRDAALWGADAAVFDPARWLRDDADADAADKRSNYAFMTFMHGPRACIGASFARAELACVLAAWVGRFEFALRDAEDMDEAALRIRTGVTQRPLKGMHVRVRVLDGW